MTPLKFPAIRFKQTEESSWISYFSVNVMDLDLISGIPQKRTFDNVESIGFQRTVKEERLTNLINFYSDQRNVVQNPLVCATRNPSKTSNLTSKVEFLVDEKFKDNSSIQLGQISVYFDKFDEMTLLESLIELKAQLVDRVVELKDIPIDQSLLATLKERFYSNDTTDDQNIVESNNNESSDVSLENSHIKEFWQEIICRIEIIETENVVGSDEVLGFSKEAITSYLKPIVIVDGQHRLAGAIECAKKISTDSKFHEVTDLIEKGTDPDLAMSTIQKKYARELPVSLLMSDDPEEHVFQFVVVNQKATPINQALLGTIVSTTLADEELTKVTDRLKNADIPLEDSRAISTVTRRSDSPFYGLVQTGIEKEKSGKLQWAVMKSLVSMFRDLKGGKSYSSEDKNDHILNWQTDYLSSSKIISQDEDECTIENWRNKDIWYDVFKLFWTKVRDHFGHLSDPNENHYWGNTSSNLFNKVTLNILAVDFFSFLYDKEYSIDSVDLLDSYIDKWLNGASPNYFSSDWNLTVKKDTPAMRKNWNTLWVNYRKTPVTRKKLPNKTEFSKF